MAHLLEHLVFKGTPRFPNIPQELSSRGARPNGTTWYDRTNYFETFAATDDNLRWALDLESDRMINSFIAEKDLQSEFSVVRNEFERGENSPFRVLLERVMALPAVRTLAPDPRLVRVHYDWLEAGEVAQRTIARLSEQLRRFLDDQSFVENRRILQIIRQIEQHALAVRQRAARQAGARAARDDRHVEFAGDREQHAPFPAPIEFGDDDAGQADRGVEAPRLLEAVLAGDGVDHEPGVLRFAWVGAVDHAPDLLQLLHEVVLRVQPPSGIDDEQIVAGRHPPLRGLVRDRRAVAAVGEDGRVDP
jgi:hypothetical protein